MKGLASSFFVHGKITTTEAKAKELRPYVEKLITRAKEPTPADRRLVAAVVDGRAFPRLLKEAGKFVGRNGGYTRIIKLGMRKSDSAKMAILELVK